jgi:hypothetical protein
MKISSACNGQKLIPRDSWDQFKRFFSPNICFFSYASAKDRTPDLVIKRPKYLLFVSHVGSRSFTKMTLTLGQSKH